MSVVGIIREWFQPHTTIANAYWTSCGRRLHDEGYIHRTTKYLIVFVCATATTNTNAIEATWKHEAITRSTQQENAYQKIPLFSANLYKAFEQHCK